ncbi:chaplin [Streptomyces sp. NPDC046915]|uniref:chaplin n=1 Tax=Streptomyces sp. NPDC046915 TaxID=3155257 RepID=UPI00340113CE
MSRIAKGLVLTSAAVAAIAGGAGVAAANSTASGAAANSPGVLSGDVIEAPVHVPVIVCGNTIDGAGFLNPSLGNYCVER